MDKALKQVPWGRFALVYLYALIAASPLLLYLFEVRVLDRYLDVFYLGICLVGGIILPNKRVYLLSLILAVYVAFGFILSEGFSFNVFVYEVKLFVFLYLYFIWKDYKVEFDSEDLKKFILVVLFSTVIFFVLFPERRLNLINESNYFCMLFGVIGFSLLETVKDEKYVVRYRVVFFLLSLFVIVLAQSRTGLAFLGGCWAIYLYRVYGVVTFFYAFSIAILLIFLGMPFISELELFSRLSALSDVSSVDRFIFLDSIFILLMLKESLRLFFQCSLWGTTILLFQQWIGGSTVGEFAMICFLVI